MQHVNVCVLMREPSGDCYLSRKGGAKVRIFRKIFKITKPGGFTISRLPKQNAMYNNSNSLFYGLPAR